jgi:exoribonuclease-2
LSSIIILNFPHLSLALVLQSSGEMAGGSLADGPVSCRPSSVVLGDDRSYFFVNADLIVQRLIKATIAGQPAPYSFEELTTIAAHCNERESAARKVERQMNKTVAASVMATRIGEDFDAIVTGINERGTFARILNPPIDGRIVENEQNLQIGDEIRVLLIDTDVGQGFIDFSCIS